MGEASTEFTVRQQEAANGAPGALARFPYDRATVERFRAAFPRARWREDLRAWFVPGTRAEGRLTTWSGREWSGVLAHADARGRDAFAFEPIDSPYLTAEDELTVRTPYAPEVVAALRSVSWARWDPPSKSWRVPFRALEDLRRRWPQIEEAARRAEPEERRKRAAERRALPEHADRLAEAAERRRGRYPVPENALPPLDRALATVLGCVVFTAITGELVEPATATRFYPDVRRAGATLIWASRRRPTHAELVHTPPARDEAGPADVARGWWPPSLALLRTERHKAASLERARETRRADGQARNTTEDP